MEVEELRVFLAGGGICSASSVVLPASFAERFKSDGEGTAELISDALRFEDLVPYVEFCVSMVSWRPGSDAVS